MTWNCRIGGFRGKAKHVAPFRPDVAAIQEVEPIHDLLLFAGDHQPTYRDRIGDPAYPRRGIAVLSYTDTALVAVDTTAPLYGFRRYEARRGNLEFQIVGIWTAAPKYRQAHDGLVMHRDWIRQRPTVMLGDFNENASFRGKNWRELIDLTDALGLVSAYHHHFSEPFGAESRPTHFHGGKETRRFHIDYCFVPEAWLPQIVKVDVGTHSDWCAISDHVPIVVDVDL